MSPARTLWEEGRLSSGRVVAACTAALVVICALDVLAFGRLNTLFDIAFAVVCTGAALAIRPGQFFWIAVLPPLLLLATMLVLAVVHPAAIGEADDGRVQALFTGLAHHSGALFAGYAYALVVLGVRARAARMREESVVRRTSPYAVRLDQAPRRTADV